MFILVQDIPTYIINVYGNINIRISQLNMTTFLVIYWTLPVAQHIKRQFSQSQISDIDYVTTDKSWGKLWPRPLLRIYWYTYIIYIYKYLDPDNMYPLYN